MMYDSNSMISFRQLIQAQKQCCRMQLCIEGMPKKMRLEIEKLIR